MFNLCPCSIVLCLLVLNMLMTVGSPQYTHYFHKHNRNYRRHSGEYMSEAIPYPRGSKVGLINNRNTYHKSGDGDVYRKHIHGDNMFHLHIGIDAPEDDYY